MGLAQVLTLFAVLAAPRPVKGAPDIYPAAPAPPRIVRHVPFAALLSRWPATTGLPDCRASALGASVSLQGATGNMLGGFTLRNRGATTCVLRGPPTLILLDSTGHRLALTRQRNSSGWPLAGLRKLRLEPGGAASAWLLLANACTPRSSARLWVVLGGGEGRVELGVGAEGRCDAPALPPGYAIGGFDPGPPALTTERRTEQRGLRVAGVAIARTAHPGTTLRYSVTVENILRRPVALAHCPLLFEQLRLSHPAVVFTRQYVLNCAPLGGALAPGAAATFEMRLPIPAGTRVRADLEWGLEIARSPLPARVGGRDAVDGPGLPELYTWVNAPLTVGR